MLTHLIANPLNAPITEITTAISTDIPSDAFFDGANWVTSGVDGLIDTIFNLFTF